MPATIDRKYQMTRLDKGDYLLPSNDATILWRIQSYEETGSLIRDDNTPIIGTFWQTWKWDSDWPTDAALLDALELDDWARWQNWSGPFRTRAEAVDDALSTSERIAARRER